MDLAPIATGTSETLKHPLVILGNMRTHISDPPERPLNPIPVGEGALACAQVLERTLRFVEASIIEHLDQVELSGVYRSDGHPHMRAFQMAAAHVSRSVARDRWLTVRLCRRAPEVLKGLRCGDLGVEQVRLLARTGVRPRVGHVLTHDAAMFTLLLELARTLPFAQFETAVAHWVTRADQNGPVPDHRDTHERRNASLTISGDQVIVRAALPIALGSQIQAILEAFGEAEFALDVEASDTPGWLPRTDAQRRADAFVAMCIASLGPNGALSVSVGIVMDAATFDAAVTRQAVPMNAAGVQGRCHTLTGMAIHPHDAVAAALWGSIHRVVIDSSDTVINLGRSGRLFTGSARRAAQALGTWCEMPGCDRQGRQVDHLHGWIDGGATDQHNAARLCGFHNRWKFASSYTVRRGGDGRLNVTRPDGSHVAAI